MWTRRALIKAGGLSLFALGVTPGPSFLRRAALSPPAPRPFTRRKTLVTLFQRGAMDGLAAVAPVSDPHLAELRPRLALSAARGAGEARMHDLGVGFGLHPAFEPLLPLWQDGRLGMVHAVGSPDPTRSHFDAQDYMETGTPGVKSTSSGWLNRVVGRLGHEPTGAADPSPLQAVSLTSALPRSLHGPASALAVEDLSSFRIRDVGALPGGDSRSGFEALYEETSQDLLRRTGGETFEAMELLDAVRREAGRAQSGADYPRSPLGRSLAQVAMLIEADAGLEVAFVESSGWDTHVGQGAAQGSFARRGRDLAASIAAFWRDLGQRRDDVMLLTMTEFGRTVAENGSGGTDHGHGSCLFVLGNDVEGGEVHGDFPSLAPADLYEGRDLPVTTDFRAVFSEVAAVHLGVATGEAGDRDPGDGESDGAIFPGWTGDRLPLFRQRI